MIPAQQRKLIHIYLKALKAVAPPCTTPLSKLPNPDTLPARSACLPFHLSIWACSLMAEDRCKLRAAKSFTSCSNRVATFISLPSALPLRSTPLAAVCAAACPVAPLHCPHPHLILRALRIQRIRLPVQRGRIIISRLPRLPPGFPLGASPNAPASP